MSDFAYLADNRFLKVGPPTEATPWAVAGVAWDGSTTNRSGSRMGPRAIREASHMLCDGTHPLFDLSPVGQLGDLGDLRLPNTGLERMREVLQREAAALIPRHRLLWLGGDHSITLPLLREYRRHLGRPLAVIHFDAHCDTWTDHFGEPSGHGTWVYEAIQEGLVVDTCFTQIGIRSAGERAAREYVRERGGQIFTARDLRGLVSAAQLAPVLQAIRGLYLSLDIDCLDPAYAPGTGTPEPGGLSSAQVLTILEELADLPFVGMDCVEVSPPYDHAEITSQAAAHFVWTFLCGQIARGQAAPPRP